MIEERKFQNDGVWTACPLRMMIGASNEWPLGEGYQELGAMFDRFLIRKQIKPVSPVGRRRLFFGDLPGITKSFLTLPEIDAAYKAAQALPVPVETEDAFLTIIESLGREGILPGDRRGRKAIKVAKAAAWLDGASEVSLSHLEPLKHVLWEDPRDQMTKCFEVVAKIANPMGHEITTVLNEAVEALEKIDMNEIASVSAGIKKAKHSMDRLQKLGLAGGGDKCTKAITYIQDRCNDIQARLMGIKK
jgi:MoxR-like ATPase